MYETNESLFPGSPLFPGGMMQDQMSPYGPFWERGPSFGGQIGQWPVSGRFGQNGQPWLPNDQNGWNNPLSDNNINGLSGQWSGQSQNIWPMTDDQYNNVSKAHTYTLRIKQTNTISSLKFGLTCFQLKLFHS